MGTSLSGYFDLFRQYQTGEINKRTFEQFRFAVYVCIPGVGQFLESTGENLEPDLRDYVSSVPRIADVAIVRLAIRIWVAR